MEDHWRSGEGKAAPKRRRNIEQLTKSYVDLVAEAISSTPTKTMTVGDICAYLKGLYGSGKSETTLKVNCIFYGSREHDPGQAPFNGPFKNDIFIKLFSG